MNLPKYLTFCIKEVSFLTAEEGEERDKRDCTFLGSVSILAFDATCPNKATFASPI